MNIKNSEFRGQAAPTQECYCTLQRRIAKCVRKKQRFLFCLDACHVMRAVGLLVLDACRCRRSELQPFWTSSLLGAPGCSPRAAPWFQQSKAVQGFDAAPLFLFFAAVHRRPGHRHVEGTSGLPMAPKHARPPTPHEQRLLTIRERRHEAQAQLLALRAEHKKDWVVQQLDVVVGRGLGETINVACEGRERVCGELGDMMGVQRVVKHFVGQESRKHRRLLKRSARLSLTDLVEIVHMRGLEARDPGAEAAPAPEAGEASPPAAQAEAPAEQAAEQSEEEGEPQISEHESNEADASAAPSVPGPARQANASSASSCS